MQNKLQIETGIFLALKSVFHPRSESGADSHPIGPVGVRATLTPRCDYTSHARSTQTYRDGRGSQEVSIAPSLDSNRLRIGRNGPIIALWAAVQPAKSLILGTSGLIDPPGPRLRPPDLYIIRKLSERRIRLSNNTIFSNVALNAKFITHASEIL